MGPESLEPGGRPVSLLRAEGRSFAGRCLIVANDFYLRAGTAPGGKRRKVELVTETPFFCCVGTWRPEQPGWHAAFAGITVEAYPDIKPFQSRHMAVVREVDRFDWMRGIVPTGEVLRPFPVGSFRV